MTEVVISGQVGPQVLGDGAEQPLRQGKSGEAVITDLHGRYYEQTYRGNVFSDGMLLASISNATYTVATTGATVTPIAGVWNPATSPVNVIVLQVTLGVTMTALQATGPSGFAYSMSVGNSAITTGNTPLSRKTLALSGSYAKGLCNVAPTGLTTALTARFGSALGGGSAGYAFLATAVAMQTQANSGVENFDGLLIVPPGGVLALLANTTPVAHSAVSSIVWEEVPL